MPLWFLCAKKTLIKWWVSWLKNDLRADELLIKKNFCNAKECVIDIF